MSEPTRPTAETQVWPGHAAAERYETPLARIGRRGLNLQDAIDELDPAELSRAVNVVSKYGSVLQVRPGQRADGTTQQGYGHSLYRMNDPQDSTYARFAGLGTTLWRGTTGAFTLIDSGYSGDPLIFTGVTMPEGNQPYVFVSDRARMRKVTRTGSVEQIGIPPAVIPAVVLIGQSRKEILQFEVADGSNAAAWTKTAGRDRETLVASGAPTMTDIFGNLGVQVTTVVGGATGAYDSSVSIAKALNLDWLQDGVVKATDDDQTHILFNIDQPQYLEELKIYLVCSTPFTTGAIPGATAGANPDAFFKSFRPNDLQPYFERDQSGLDAGTDLRERTLIEEFKLDQATGDTRDGLYLEALNLGRQDIPQIPVGRQVWGEFGILGAPLRRGDWQRIGTDTTRGWNTITGVVIVIQTAAAQPLVIQLDSWYLYGGSGPDNSDPGLSKYDVRVRNRHSRNGSKGNPSPVQPEVSWFNALRQSIQVTPVATGITLMRQQAFLRGGSATGSQDWYFAGENASDGGAILITVADDERITEETLEIDNDQPVTSVDEFGGTVLNQTVPVFFQIDQYWFACGDPNQPGRLYRSKLQNPESWPATEYRQVCPGSEQLMNGAMLSTGGFVFSRIRMYAVLVQAGDDWTTEPTTCNEGLAGRWALAVTPYGIAFVSPFGVRLTQGGPPDTLSDEMLGRLFRGETVNGYAPIDFSKDTKLELAYHDDELWFTYQDTGVPVATRQLIYNFKDKTWRGYLFGKQVGSVYSEPTTPGNLLMIGSGSGKVYSHAGFADESSAIAYTARTGAWAFGEPRHEKSLTEVVIDADLQGGDLTVQTYLNQELTTNTAQAVTGVTGERRYLFEPFGTAPQRARNVSVELRGNAPTSARPSFNQIGVTQRLEPQIKLNEPTPWEELPGGEGYAWGVAITCDTNNAELTVLVEGTTNNGSITTLATLTVQADGRKKLPFSFASTLVQQIRLRPENDCGPWIVWKIEWLSDPEPIRVPGWDTNWEACGTLADKWIKGYIIEADTFGVAKTVVLDKTDETGVQTLAVDTLTLTLTGRGVYQHSFAKISGRHFRLRSTDANFGKLYRWQPIFDEEPLSLTRWEGQERPFPGMEGRWQKPLEAFVCLRSTGTVTWNIHAYGYAGVLLNTHCYTIASTAGVKVKVRVPFVATKGLLFRHLFTAAAGFWLYKEESEVLVEDLQTGQAKWLPIWPMNDDLDPARAMGNAQSAAQTPGGQ